MEDKMTKTRRKVFFAAIIGVIFILLVFLFLQYQNANAEKKSQYGNRTQEIEALELQLNQKGLSPDTQAAIKSKLQALYYQVTLQAAGIIQLTLMPTEAEAALRTMAQPKPGIVEKRITGIIDNPSVPFPRSDFQISNAWQDFIDGGYLTIYAGALAKDSTQGVLLISHEGGKNSTIILSPYKNGSLTIAAYHNGLLIINTSTKYQFTFDLSMMAFVDIHGKAILPVPTSMPPLQTQTAIPPYPPPY